MSARSRNRERDLLVLYPKRLHEWEEGEGKVTVLVPRFTSRAGKAMGRLLRLPEFYRINMDELGSAVWLLSDGKRNSREIAERLREDFGERAEPLFQRLAEFCSQAEAGGLLEMRDGPA